MCFRRPSFRFVDRGPSLSSLSSGKSACSAAYARGPLLDDMRGPLWVSLLFILVMRDDGIDRGPFLFILVVRDDGIGPLWGFVQDAERWRCVTWI